MSDRAEQFKALTVKQHIAQTEVDRIGAARAMLLASWHAESGLSYAKIGVEVGLKRATVQQLVERGREIMKPTTYTTLAASRTDVDQVCEMLEAQRQQQEESRA